MATIAKQAIEVAHNVGKPVVRHYAEKALQTFKRGAILILDANGFATEGGADPANILGVANEDGGNKAADGDRKVEVILPGKDTFFIGNIGGAVATAQSQLLKAFGVVKEGNNWHIDTADVTATRVVLEDFILRPDMVLGDTNGLALFTFRAGSIAHENGL